MGEAARVCPNHEVPAAAVDAMLLLGGNDAVICADSLCMR